MQPTQDPIIKAIDDGRVNFLHAKYDARSGPAPYLIGGEPTDMPSGVVESTMSVVTAPDYFGGAYSDLGTKDYAVIAYCPALSCMYGGQGTGGTLIPNTSKLAGLCVFQTDNTSASMRDDMFVNSLYGFPLSSIYGSQGDKIGSNTFIWSSFVHSSFLTLDIGRAGIVHQLTLPFSSLKNEDGADAYVSVSDMIRLAKS